MAEPNFAKPCVFLELKSYHPANLATTLPQQGGITAVAIDDQSTQAFAKGFAGQQLTKKATRTGPRSITLSFPGEGKMEENPGWRKKNLLFCGGLLLRDTVARYLGSMTDVVKMVAQGPIRPE